MEFAMTHRALITAFLFIALLPLAALAAGVEPLKIVSQNGEHAFTVEMAVNDEERSRGLMFRKEVPEGKGMLFDFQTEQDVAFWMKNTYVSLDMIFIRADGVILSIAENTPVLSLKPIPSGGPVRGVLEVAAGTAKRLGIKPGDHVVQRIFDRK
jgi:uncharacterized membrane protein (UPF0127 family)